MKAKDKFYNIDKATPLVTVEKTFGKKYGENPDDDWSETLYKKTSGEFFVYGKGGKNTPFSTDENGEPVAGSRYEIWIDYNYQKAKNWVYTNCPDRMDVIFMKESEDSKKSVTTVTLSTKARLNLKRKSNELGITTSELIRRWAESLYE